MVRTQIQLTEEQADRVKRIASERGVSMATVIREAVDRYALSPSRDELWERALAVVGKYSSDKTDLARNHDRYLAEDFLA